MGIGSMASAGRKPFPLFALAFVFAFFLLASGLASAAAFGLQDISPAELASLPDLSSNPAIENWQENVISTEQRLAAAENLKQARLDELKQKLLAPETPNKLQAGNAASNAIQTNAVVNVPAGFVTDASGALVPHYYGPYPNWANSPMPKGPVSGITLMFGGSGYSASPMILIYDVYSTGTGATATATVTAGVITSITLTNSGSNYTAPEILIIDATGTGAEAIASVGGTLTGGIRKFVNALPGLTAAGANDLNQYIPLGIADSATYPGSDYYEIAVVQYKEKMHSDLPATLLRGYVQLETSSNFASSKHIALANPDGSPILKADGTRAIAVDIPHYLGPTIVSTRDRPVRIKFSNLLPTGSGGDLFIPVDTSVMGSGAGPLDSMGMPCMGMGGMGMPCENYTQNRATLHLHGGFVTWISDGTAHQWTVPANETTQYPKGVSVAYVPDMWFQNGTVIPNTVGQTAPPVAGASNNPGDGSLTFYYNNQQSARLQFYHDHSMGITRLNVYAGEAAGYLITDQVEQDLIDGTNNSGVNPGLAKVLSDLGIPLVIQDRSFVDSSTIQAQDPTWTWSSNGSGIPQSGDLWFPHVYMSNQNPYDPSGMNAFGRWHYGPWFWPPTTNITHGPAPNPYYEPGNPMEPATIPGVPSVSMAGEAFMDTPIVNGAAYPYLDVEPKAYRFRILNASDDRFFNLQLYVADSNVITADGRLNTEVKMVPASSTVGFPPEWPTDGRVGGVPDPATAGPSFIQIGTEGGFLPEPAVLQNLPVAWNLDPTNFDMGVVNQGTLILGTAERADVIVDFSQFAGKTIILYNDSPAPFPALDARYDYYTGNEDLTSIGGTPPTLAGYGPNTRTIMQFRVKPAPVAALYDIASLNSVFAKTVSKPGVFETSQDPILVPQSYYNSAYNNSQPIDNFARIGDNNMAFQTLAGNTVAVNFQPKAIQDEMGEVYDIDYGRMSGMLGLELPKNQAGAQNFLLYPFGTPPVEVLKDSMVPLSPVADDGTQIWKITHNGVDTHTIHFHLFNVQLINRVAWDNALRLPDPNEIGWKETVRVNPLQDTIVALRPYAPTQPFEIPNSIRAIDPTMPEGEALHGGPGGIADTGGNPVSVINHKINYGWEYVYHCHLLAHEEMDMMHAVLFAVAPYAPANLSASANAGTAHLTWTDNSISETGFRVQKATSTSGPWTTIATLDSNTGPAKGGIISFDDAAAGGFAYSYRVAGINTVGDSAIYAAPAIGFPTTTAESLPTNVVTIAAGACQSSADSDGNNIVSMAELLVHIGKWKQGTVTMQDLLAAISFWKSGAGC